MGNGQNLIRACVPQGGDDDSRQVAMQQLTDEEIDNYIKSVRASVDSQIESISDRFARYYNAFVPKKEELVVATNAFVDELNIGIEKHSGSKMQDVPCSLKMLESFVPKDVTGRETGIYYAVDFGGSNIRILRVAMDNGHISVQAKKANLFDYKSDLPRGLLDPKATATMLFDFFAQVAHEFLQETGDLVSGQTFPLGYTFSYPCKFRSLKSADLIVWTKGFETGRETDDPVEGCDVGVLMNMAFQRNQVPLYVNCIANDTVGTLLAAAYTLPQNMPPCLLAMILGTGVNACYVEANAHEAGYVGKIINIESGNFNRALPTTNIDHEVDFADVGGRGQHHYEKMVSGGYLGEVCRRAFVKIFQSKTPAKMFVTGTFSSEDAAVVIGDKSEKYVVVDRKCREVFDHQFNQTELGWIQDICQVVFRRSASLAATQIAGGAIKTGKLQAALGGLTCAIDGSLWKCNAFYREDIRRYLETILGKNQADLIQLIGADDGSGVGAAVLAALAS